MHLSNEQVSTIKANLTEAGLLPQITDGWDALTQVGFDQFCLRFAPDFEFMVGKQPINAEQVPPALLGETYAASVEVTNTPIPNLVEEIGGEAAAEVQAESPQPEVDVTETLAPKLVEELGSVEAAAAEVAAQAEEASPEGDDEEKIVG